MVTYSILPHSIGFVSSHNFRQRNKLASFSLVQRYKLHLLKLVNFIVDTPNRTSSYFRQEMYW